MAYAIPEQFVRFPPADHLQTTIYIKHVEIKGNLVKRFSYERLRSNLLAEYLIQTQEAQHIDRLMTITFKEERRDKNANSSSIFASYILNRGVEFCGEIFHYLGHSNSQLKDKTCYLYCGSPVEIHELLAQFSDFSSIPKVAKRAKRIGLLFSGFNKSISLHTGEYEDIGDIENRDYNFTDGCGMMSDTFCNEIQRSHKLKHQPSVVQIRYQGYKGVLLHNPELQHVKVQFRKSMKKFGIPDPLVKQRCSTFGVVDVAKPYSNGFLNTQLAMVLADNHESTGRDYLLQLQIDFYSMLRDLCTNEELTLRYLTITGRTELLHQIRKNGFWHRRVQKDLEGIQVSELKKLYKNNDDVGDENNDGDDDNDDDDNGKKKARKSKLRVLVPRARVVFGVSDPFGELEDGEVFFQPTLPETEIAAFSDSPKVVVGRNPCYHPGDVRVLKLVHVEDKLRYTHLYDCLVFPVKGKRPHSHECSGGDLDGDKYFVSWDERLVPQWQTNPFRYDEPAPFDGGKAFKDFLKKHLVTPLSKGICSFGRAYMSFLFGTEEESVLRQKTAQRKELQTYFACYENDLVCRVNAIYMKYAGRYGPSCAVCVDLNKYFSDAVDMNATKSEFELHLRNLERRFRETERRENSQWSPLTFHQYQNPSAVQQSSAIQRRRSDSVHQEQNWFETAMGSNAFGPKATFTRDEAVWTQMEDNAETFLKQMEHTLNISSIRR